MKKALRFLFVLSAILSISAMVVSTSFAQNNGAIWTTRRTCGDVQQDVNQYSTGDTVYINGSGFDAGSYSWSIQGQPGNASSASGGQVAGGSVTVDASGAFCFAAYTIPAGDWGEFSVKLANKGDNYRVPGGPVVSTPTFTPTSTPINTSTPEPTSTLVNTATTEPTSTSVLETPVLTTVVPTNTLVPTKTTAPILTATTGPTPVPQKAPVTGGSSGPDLLQTAALIMAVISIGAFILLQKKAD